MHPCIHVCQEARNLVHAEEGCSNFQALCRLLVVVLYCTPRCTQALIAD
jgi:hypothetical protein